MSQTNVASVGSEIKRTRENVFFHKAAERIPVARGKIISGFPMKSLFSNNKTKNRWTVLKSSENNPLIS